MRQLDTLAEHPTQPSSAIPDRWNLPRTLRPQGVPGAC